MPAASGRSRSNLPKGSHRQSGRARAGERAHRDHQAHHRLHPRRAAAGHARIACRPTARGEMVAIMFGGKRADGTTFVTGELIAGGSGAGAADRRRRRDRDRRDQLHEPAGRGDGDGGADPRSSHRAAAGFRRRRAASRRPRHREGIRDPAKARSRSPIAASGTSSRRRERRAAAPAPRRMRSSRRADGSEEVIPSKMMTTLKPGDRVVIETAGGGGNGPPATRSRSALARRPRRRKDRRCRSTGPISLTRADRNEGPFLWPKGPSLRSG